MLLAATMIICLQQCEHFKTLR